MFSTTDKKSIRPCIVKQTALDCCSNVVITFYKTNMLPVFNVEVVGNFSCSDYYLPSEEEIDVSFYKQELLDPLDNLGDWAKKEGDMEFENEETDFMFAKKSEFQERDRFKGEDKFKTEDVHKKSNGLKEENYSRKFKKNGNIQLKYLNENVEQSAFQFTLKSSKLKIILPPQGSLPYLYFQLFVNDHILNLISTETNKQAERHLKLFPQLSKRVHWNPVSSNEIKAFVAVVINMGIIRKPYLLSYWSNIASQSTPWFKQMFSIQRFLNILRFFHLADEGNKDFNKNLKFEPLINHTNEQFKLFGLDFNVEVSNLTGVGLYCFLSEKRALQQWKRIVFNTFMLMAKGSYFLYKSNYPNGAKVKSRLEFLISLVEYLSEEWLAFKNNGNPTLAGLTKLPGKKEARCCVCTSEGKKRRSRSVCNKCKKGLHGECYPKHSC